MSASTTFRNRVLISVFAAIGVHVCVLVLWILLLLWDLPIFSYEAVEAEPQPEPEVTVVLRPIQPEVIPEPLVVEKEPESKPESKPEPEPPQPKPPVSPPEVAQKTPEEKLPEQEKALPPPKRKFARTSEEQAGTPDEATDLLGDRDTRAASERAPVPGADPNTPSQDGVAPLFPGQVETVDRDYEDGSVGMDPNGETTERPQEATALKQDAVSKPKTPLVEEPEPDVDPNKRPDNKHLAIGEVIPKPEQEKVQEKPKDNESPRERQELGSKDGESAKEVEEQPKKGGFSGHSRKNRVAGSISRQGKSALNVKNTALGRYQAQVSKAIELQWRRNVERHRDHIVPGVISIRCYVDHKGKVSGIKIQDVIESNFIEQGLTQRAFRQAKLPKMPKEVVEELDGEPLELIYNFYF